MPLYSNQTPYNPYASTGYVSGSRPRITKDTNYRPFFDIPDFYGRTSQYFAASGSSPRNSMDTSILDNFREGVNIRTGMDIFHSSQPKIFFMDGQQDLAMHPNGDLTHQSTFNTFGQSQDFIQYTGQIAFVDSHLNVEGRGQNGISKMVDYIRMTQQINEGSLQESMVFPIYMNGGPQYADETIIEFFPLPFRLASIENPQEMSRGVFATFEDGGNEDDERRFGTNTIGQFVERDNSRPCGRYLLESDASYIVVTGSNGAVINVVHLRPSSVPDETVIRRITPWLDEPRNIYFPRFTNTLDLLSASVGGKSFYEYAYGTTSTELQTRDIKSATAGHSYYGGKAGLYGTDSIAFGGLIRGS